MYTKLFFLIIFNPFYMCTRHVSRVVAGLLLIGFAAPANCQLISTNSMQQQNYTATRDGKTVGWLRIISYQNGDEKSLSIESQLTIWMLLSFEAKALTVNKFKGSTLIKAAVCRTLNGKQKLNNEVQLIEGKYKIIRGDAELSVTSTIHHTVASLYFAEPVGVSEVFSEVYLCFVPLKKVANAAYASQLPDGGSMTYYYRLGKLTSITASTSYGIVFFQLNP